MDLVHKKQLQNGGCITVQMISKMNDYQFYKGPDTIPSSFAGDFFKVSKILG